MISIAHVQKRFDAEEVLKDISLTIQAGEIYGIIGQSGAGKSTLLRCINGLESYDAGSIEVNGEKIVVSNHAQLHRQQRSMGMIFQNFNLLSRLSVAENVALPMKFRGISTRCPKAKKKIQDLLQLVGLSDKADEYPKALSGGQKQRVAIARALVLDPKVLLCDEATSALDPLNTKEILSLLVQINRKFGITIVVVTHQMEVIKQICRKVAFLKDGRVMAIGRPEDLFIHPDREIKAFLGEEISALPKKGINVQLFFTEHSTEPIITAMARELHIDFSICWGKLEKFRENVFGSLVITIAPEDQDRVLAYLDARDVKWEVLKDA